MDRIDRAAIIAWLAAVAYVACVLLAIGPDLGRLIAAWLGGPLL